MAVSLATVSTDCVLMLNAGAAGGYSATVLDPRWHTTEIVDAVLTADALVCSAVYRNKDNARAYLFYITQVGLAHGGTIGNIAGPIASVKFNVTGGSAPGARPGNEWEKAEIQREIVNALGLDYDCHYATDGKVIWHNGAAIAAQSGGGTVSVDLTFPSLTKTSACQAPDEYAYIVFCGAMSLLVAVEGENVAPMGSWAQLFEAGLKEIATGEGNVTQPVAQA